MNLISIMLITSGIMFLMVFLIWILLKISEKGERL